jgi:CRP-like cAMP-binding protein
MDTSKLAGIEFFSGLSKNELQRLARWTDEIDVPEGEVLASQGRFAHEFFVIEDGTASVDQDGNHLADLGPGDFFGEIGLVETVRRTATVRATTPMRVIVMFERDFRQMEQEMPTVAARIQEAIRARLDR